MVFRAIVTEPTEVRYWEAERDGCNFVFRQKLLINYRVVDTIA